MKKVFVIVLFLLLINVTPTQATQPIEYPFIGINVFKGTTRVDYEAYSVDILVPTSEMESDWLAELNQSYTNYYTMYESFDFTDPTNDYVSYRAFFPNPYYETGYEHDFIIASQDIHLFSSFKIVVFNNAKQLTYTSYELSTDLFPDSEHTAEGNHYFELNLFSNVLTTKEYEEVEGMEPMTGALVVLAIIAFLLLTPYLYVGIILIIIIVVISVVIYRKVQRKKRESQINKK